MNNSLLLREPATSVFEPCFHSLKFLKVLQLMLFLSRISNKKKLLIFSTNNVEDEKILLKYFWNSKLRRMSVDSIQALTSTTSTQIESS